MPLGYALVRLNRLPEAIADYNQALKVEPGNPEIHNNLGYLYNHSARYNEAVAACLEAIRLLGETGEAYKQGFQTRQEVLAHAYKNLGNAYSGMNDFEQAAKALRQATVIEPKSAAAFFNLGLTLYSGRRYSEAIEAYKEVIKLRPTLVAARFNLGITYLAINDKQAATAEYDALKPLDPKAAEQLRVMIRQ
jgi:tetratricopeptide (TPR) repeat protein